MIQYVKRNAKNRSATGFDRIIRYFFRSIRRLFLKSISKNFVLLVGMKKRKEKRIFRITPLGDSWHALNAVQIQMYEYSYRTYVQLQQQQQQQQSVGQCLIVLVVRKVHSAVLALCRVPNALCSHTHATRDSFVLLFFLFYFFL